jgi:spore maturation protein CgeB
MRGEYLESLLKPDEFLAVNTDIPMKKTQRVFRSFGWRYKIGPFISNINTFIRQSIGEKDHFDLTWIDKGVFIQPELIAEIRHKSTKLVHFTPDPAFTYHRSRLFFQAIPYYDHCITTKSFELADYASNNAKSTFYCTQGYDAMRHRPMHSFEKKQGIVFIGHQEEDREAIISQLVEKGYLIKLAGINWAKLAHRYKKRSNLEYLGTGVFGEAYTNLISGSLIGLGFLSKIIPEQHTTRTLEIPACGTALLTERTMEIGAIFKDDEALFFTDPKDLIQKLDFALANLDHLRLITENGYNRVINGAFSYEAILKTLIEKIY